jgi:hypothetical protein
MALNKKRIPNAKERLELEAANAAADIADQQQKAGIPQSMTGETGMDRNGRVIDVTGFSDQKKWWAQDRQDTARELGGFKSFGDKSAFESKNAVRKLQGLPPLDANPVTQFVNDLDRSMTFLDKSALLTPEGQQRALKAGVAAGLSFEDADAAVQSAFATLQKRQKGATPTASVGPPPPPARQPEGSTPPATPVQSETKPPEKRDTSPDVSASASQRARQRGRAAEGKPTEVQPENMGEPTGPPTPATAVPVKTSSGTVWTDSSGHTYPFKPKPYDPEEYGFISFSDIGKKLNIYQPELFANASKAAEEAKKKAQAESPDTPLRTWAKSAAARAGVLLNQNTDWTKLSF